MYKVEIPLTREQYVLYTDTEKRDVLMRWAWIAASAANARGYDLQCTLLRNERALVVYGSRIQIGIVLRLLGWQ